MEKAKVKDQYIRIFGASVYIWRSSADCLNIVAVVILSQCEKTLGEQCWYSDLLWLAFITRLFWSPRHVFLVACKNSCESVRWWWWWWWWENSETLQRIYAKCGVNLDELTIFASYSLINTVLHIHHSRISWSFAIYMLASQLSLARYSDGS